MGISLLNNNQRFAHYIELAVIALLEATDSWVFDIGCRHVNAVVLLDLKTAFDTVDQDILLSKMNLNQIQGKALPLFKSY